MRSSERTTPPKTGKAPPERPVPPPRGVTGTSASHVSARTAATSSAVFGRTAISGG